MNADQRPRTKQKPRSKSIKNWTEQECSMGESAHLGRGRCSPEQLRSANRTNTWNRTETQDSLSTRNRTRCRPEQDARIEPSAEKSNEYGLRHKTNQNKHRNQKVKSASTRERTNPSPPGHPFRSRHSAKAGPKNDTDAYATLQTALPSPT